MKMKDINITEALENAKKILEDEKNMSSSVRSIMQLLILIISLLLEKLDLNSSNSSTPPSADPNRKKRGRRKPYEFELLEDSSQGHNLGSGKLYICVEDGKIVYQCLDLAGEIVQGVITQKDLPSNVQIPKTNDLSELNKLRKLILKITQDRGDTAPLKKPGGQPGRVGVTLKPFDDPDEIRYLQVDLRTLPKGVDYQEQGYVARQLVDITISRHVVEYRSQILGDEQGNQYIAAFPEGLKRDVQYGTTIKSKIVFASVYQLIPYHRVQEQFAEDYQIPVSVGSITNFIREGADQLRRQQFEQRVKKQLICSALIHSDETGVNIDGKKAWLHTASNERWSWLEPHPLRGTEAMNEIGVLPPFQGVLCHDHWKAYFQFNCVHALCNAHHLRELRWSFEQDGQKWAKKMYHFLLSAKEEVEASNKQCLSSNKYSERCKTYRMILAQGELECPEVPPKPVTKRKPKQSKSRNLLTRLRDYEKEVLLFMKRSEVPFTNNLGEREIRMSKVRQKISGCFKSLERAKDFFLLRSYLQTCKKNNVSATEALELLFNKQLPDFLSKLDTS